MSAAQADAAVPASRWSWPPGRPVPPELPRSLVAARVAQYLVDSLVLLPAWVLAMYMSLLPLRELSPDHDPARETFLLAATAGVLLTTLGVFFVWVPVRLGGRTIAMRWCGLRVVTLDGRPPTARQHLVRLLGLVLDMSGQGVVGLVTMLVTGRRRRVGDLLAGTTVVWDVPPVGAAVGDVGARWGRGGTS